MNIISLRNDLLALLEPVLGDYVFPDGNTDVAVSCLPDPDLGWNYPPHGTKVTGLEVAIKRPYPESKNLLGGDRIHDYTWEIHLKQWNTNASLQEAIELLKNLPSHYLIARTTMMPASNSLLTVEQYKIFLKEWELTAQGTI